VLRTRFGVAAVELIAEGKFGKMVALRSDSIVAVDVVHAIGQLKSVCPMDNLVGGWRHRDRIR
jgi:6-phosphofructokinase